MCVPGSSHACILRMCTFFRYELLVHSLSECRRETIIPWTFSIGQSVNRQLPQEMPSAPGSHLIGPYSRSGPGSSPLDPGLSPSNTPLSLDPCEDWWIFSFTTGHPQVLSDQVFGDVFLWLLLGFYHTS